MKKRLLNALFLTLEIIGKMPWLNYANVVGKWELRSMNLIWGYLALLRAAFGGKSLYYISFIFPFLKEKKNKNIWIWFFDNSWMVIHVICHPFWKTNIAISFALYSGKENHILLFNIIRAVSSNSFHLP